MTSINDVRIVGRLTKNPEFATTANKKEFFRLVVETERFVRVNGESRRIAHTIAVTCFNQFSIAPMREHGKAGTIVKVFGELTGVRDGHPEITVSQFNGEAAVMFMDDAAPAARAEGAERKTETSQAKPAGGLGRLNTQSQGSGTKTAAKPQSRNDDASLDDEIPF